MIVKVLPVGPLSVNTSIIVDPKTRSALVVDPGAQADAILNELKGLNPVGIFATHGHIDHVGQVAKLKEELNVPFIMHKNDEFLLTNELWEGFSSYIGALPPPPPDVHVREGDKIRVGELELTVLHTPGHTPGSCCLYSQKHGLLVAGDLLFRGSVGRWDLPGGDLHQLKKSVKRVLTELPPDTLVVCGHYDETTIENERLFNPLARELLRE
ncbi:MAG: MBL fold metallo-hydrolase [Aquificae bacterium]|nr:MBL fold metallo-hydrolase [Aquificota bacterium]